MLHSQCSPMPSHITAVVPKHSNSHTSFSPSTSLSIPGNNKREGKIKGFVFLCRHKTSTDTCKLLQQSKPCFAGLSISSVLLAQEQVSQSSSQVGGTVPGNRSSSLAIYRGNVVVATVKHFPSGTRGKFTALYTGHTNQNTPVFCHRHTSGEKDAEHDQYSPFIQEIKVSLDSYHRARLDLCACSLHSHAEPMLGRELCHHNSSSLEITS